MGGHSGPFRPMAALYLILLALASIVTAVCPCGFQATNPNNDTETWLFTEMLETDFTKLHDVSQSKAWERQEFNVSAKDGRGLYGKQFKISNVQPRPGSLVEGDFKAPPNGAGLELRVNSSMYNEAVAGAEVDSKRLDLQWGSYRAGMKVTDTIGTCAAFFWYFNDTQEIDMEFLSREFRPEENIWPLSLVIQSMESKAAGYDASKTGTYQIVNLTFDPTADFHEYRFDYLPGRVLFFADSELLAEMQGPEIPSVGGHLILQHWSNGNPNWSGGPPKEDALVTFSYVKAYFNSSDPDRLLKQTGKCNDAEPVDKNVCIIPQGSASNAINGGPYFGEDRNGNGVTDTDENAATLTVRKPMVLLMWMMIVSVAMCYGQV